MLSGGSRKRRFDTTARVVILLTLSLSCVAFLIYAGVYGTATASLSFRVGSLLVTSIALGALLLAVILALLLLRVLARMREQDTLAKLQNKRLKKSLKVAESILRSEPHAVIFWEPRGKSYVAVNTLEQELALPIEDQDILDFNFWLEPIGADRLEGALKALFQTGKPFNFILKTIQGEHVEADGRSAGGRPLLRLTSLTGCRLVRAQNEVLEEQRGDVVPKAAGHAVSTVAGAPINSMSIAQTLLRSVPMPVWIRNDEGRLEWVNEAYSKAVKEIDKTGLIEKQIELLEERQRKSIEHTLDEGDIFRERLHTVIGGERRTYDVIATSLESFSAGIAIDRAALEIVEGELDRHIEAHTRTLDHVSTAIAIFGPDQRLNFCNQAYLDLWKFDAAWADTGPKDGEILDRLREMRQLPEQANYRDWKAMRLAAYQTSKSHEDWWYLPDGRSLHVVAEQSPDGGMTYLYDDATERLALESRYNALLDARSETLDNLREGVAVFATDGRLTLFNRAFALIWNLDGSKLHERPHIDQIIEQSCALHDDNSVWNEIKRAVTSIHEHRQPIGGQLNRADSTIIAYSCQPLPDGATLITYSDVTDSKRAEQMLIERNEALETADRLKNDFIQNVSYELRTPLTNIIGFSEFLSNPKVGDLNEKQIEYLGDIRLSSSTLLAIINDILDLATIDAGVFEIKHTQIKVDSVIRATVTGIRERMKQAEVSLKIRIGSPEVEFIGDERRITQVLQKLLSNAIEGSSPGGRITLICRQEKSWIVFSVVDKGCGIPVEYQDSVFKRFESRSQGAQHRKGTGLGLAIVKSITELHGGDVTLDSTLGEGTTVTVRFPIKETITQTPVAPMVESEPPRTIRKIPKIVFKSREVA